MEDFKRTLSEASKSNVWSSFFDNYIKKKQISHKFLPLVQYSPLFMPPSPPPTMTFKLDCFNFKPGDIEAALIQIKENKITDIVFKGFWFNEFLNLFHSIELGETKVTRLFFNFEHEFGVDKMLRYALVNLCVSTLSTVELLDFSNTKPSWFLYYSCTLIMDVVFNQRPAYIPDFYIRLPNPIEQVSSTFTHLKNLQNDHRVQLILLVLASGKQWKRGTRNSALKKFPKDMIQLTASFLL
jgi:hypothetical protein